MKIIHYASHWEHDQTAWSVDSESETNPFTKLEHNIITNRSKMEPSSSSQSSNNTSISQLQLKQITNDIKQLRIHLLTLQTIEDSDEVDEKINDIQQEFDFLQDEKKTSTDLSVKGVVCTRVH